MTDMMGNNFIFAGNSFPVSLCFRFFIRDYDL
jgi:hypothetical protein